MIMLKMAARNFLPGCIAFGSLTVSDSKEIGFKSAIQLGKKFLVTIFSVIVHSSIFFLQEVGLLAKLIKTLGPVSTILK